MSEIQSAERKLIKEALAEAIRPIMDKYNVSVSVKVWRDDDGKDSNVIAFRR